MKNPIFITGGTGYIGKRLIKKLLVEGYTVKALVRKGSEKKLPYGCSFFFANPFDPLSFLNEIPENSVFIQLLGVPHPGPKKKALFYSIDLPSVRASVTAAVQARVGHFIYMSVAQTPTKVMQDYQHCRAEGEKMITETGLKATFIRPWYIIGPGHYWPLFLAPLFTLLEFIPATSHKAKALRLVYVNQMLHALMDAVKHPPGETIRVIEIDEIRKMG